VEASTQFGGEFESEEDEQDGVSMYSQWGLSR